MASRRNHSGLSLVEVLLSLAIVALLLTSVAVAIEASMRSYGDNDKSAAMTQTARFTLQRITRDIRTAQTVTLATSADVTIVPADGLSTIEYQYQNGVLQYSRTVAGVTTSGNILDSTGDVVINSFQIVQDADTKNYVVQLGLLIDGRKSCVLTASAAVRQDQSY